MDDLLTLQQATKSMVSGTVEKPPASQLAIALLSVEKAHRKSKSVYHSEQLNGRWRLCFITGTKQVQNRANLMMRSGRYLPRWVTVELTYTPPEDDSPIETGTLENSIQLGGFAVTLTGPARFLTPKSILAFDFTKIKVKLGNQTLYSGSIRGGKKREAMFDEASLAQQAFFTYFLITDNLIAARGRGGGLALWGRSSGQFDN